MPKKGDAGYLGRAPDHCRLLSAVPREAVSLSSEPMQRGPGTNGRHGGPWTETGGGTLPSPCCVTENKHHVRRHLGVPPQKTSTLTPRGPGVPPGRL